MLVLDEARYRTSLLMLAMLWICNVFAVVAISFLIRSAVLLQQDLRDLDKQQQDLETYVQYLRQRLPIPACDAPWWDNQEER